MEYPTDIVGLELEELTMVVEPDLEDGDAFGVVARAVLQFKTRCGGWYLGPTVQSPGLWGIPNDSEEYGMNEYGPEQLEILSEMLEALGIRVKDWPEYETARESIASGAGIERGV